MALGEDRIGQHNTVHPSMRNICEIRLAKATIVLAAIPCSSIEKLCDAYGLRYLHNMRRESLWNQQFKTYRIADGLACNHSHLILRDVESRRSNRLPTDLDHYDWIVFVTLCIYYRRDRMGTVATCVTLLIVTGMESCAVRALLNDDHFNFVTVMSE